MFQTIATVIVFIAMVISYSLNKLPMAITSLISLLMLVLLRCVSAADVLSTIGSSTVITMMSMFVIGAAVGKTRLTSYISEKLTMVSGGSFRKTIAVYVLLTFLLGQFMPTTTSTVALACPIIVEACKKNGIAPSKILYSIALVTVAASWTLTPIGPYAANYIESNGMLAEYGLEAYQFTILDEMIDKLPCTLFVVLWAIFAAPDFAPEIFVKDTESGNNGSDLKETVKIRPNPVLNRFQEYAAYSVFIIVIISLCFSSFGYPSWLIPAIGAVIVVLCGILDAKAAKNSLGLDIIMIYIGAATLGNAFASTGAGDIIGRFVSTVLGRSGNSYLVGAVFFVSSYVMTSLIYNRAVSKILIPIILVSSVSMNCDPRGLMRLCYIGSMCSLMTPMATTAVPIIMGSAGYSQKDLIRMNLIPALGMCIVSVLFVMSRYPCW